MKTSESITEISAALAKALPEIQNATKDADNPAYRSSYATLNSVMDAVKPPRFEHGVVVIQGPGWRDGIVTVTTRFLHESGEWIETEAGAPVAHRWERVDGEVTDKGPDAQTAGSAISYLRRYSLAAMAGITQEDDDGNAASGRAGQSAPSRKPASKPSDGDLACPTCSGPMWDNRADELSAVNGGKRPDLKCRDKACDTAIWLGSVRDDLKRDLESATWAEILTDDQRNQLQKAIELYKEHPDKLLKGVDWLRRKMTEAQV